MKKILLKLMGIWERPELERMIDSGYKLSDKLDNNTLLYQKQNNYIIYDLNKDKVIKQYRI